MDNTKNNAADIEDIFANNGKYNTRVKISEEDAL